MRWRVVGRKDRCFHTDCTNGRKLEGVKEQGRARMNHPLNRLAAPQLWDLTIRAGVIGGMIVKFCRTAGRVDSAKPDDNLIRKLPITVSDTH